MTSTQPQAVRPECLVHGLFKVRVCFRVEMHGDGSDRRYVARFGTGNVLTTRADEILPHCPGFERSDLEHLRDLVDRAIASIEYSEGRRSSPFSTRGRAPRSERYGRLILRWRNSRTRRRLTTLRARLLREHDWM